MKIKIILAKETPEIHVFLFLDCSAKVHCREILPIWSTWNIFASY